MNDQYNVLREFADSWGLLAMFIFFLGAVAMALRPSAKQAYSEAAEIPFKENK
jgi:cytochrome c oxidase cbb3-type subunit 4